MIDLIAYYNSIKDKTAEELAGLLYGNSGSVINLFNDAHHGRDVKDDITRSAMLLTEYLNRVTEWAGTVADSTPCEVRRLISGSNISNVSASASTSLRLNVVFMHVAGDGIPNALSVLDGVTSETEFIMYHFWDGVSEHAQQILLVTDDTAGGRPLHLYRRIYASGSWQENWTDLIDGLYDYIQDVVDNNAHPTATRSQKGEVVVGDNLEMNGDTLKLSADVNISSLQASGDIKSGAKISGKKAEIGTKVIAAGDNSTAMGAGELLPTDLFVVKHLTCLSTRPSGKKYYRVVTGEGKSASEVTDWTRAYTMSALSSDLTGATPLTIGGSPTLYEITMTELGDDDPVDSVNHAYVFDAAGTETAVTLQHILDNHGSVPLEVYWQAAWKKFNLALGDNSMTSGRNALALGDNSAAIGENLVAAANNQTVVGKYNEPVDDAMFVVGGGEDDENRKNLFEVKEDGLYYNGEKMPIVKDAMTAIPYTDDCDDWRGSGYVIIPSNASPIHSPYNDGINPPTIVPYEKVCFCVKGEHTDQLWFTRSTGEIFMRRSTGSQASPTWEDWTTNPRIDDTLLLPGRAADARAVMTELSKYCASRTENLCSVITGRFAINSANKIVVPSSGNTDRYYGSGDWLPMTVTEGDDVVIAFYGSEVTGTPYIWIAWAGEDKSIISSRNRSSPAKAPDPIMRKITAPLGAKYLAFALECEDGVVSENTKVAVYNGDAAPENFLPYYVVTDREARETTAAYFKSITESGRNICNVETGRYYYDVSLGRIRAVNSSSYVGMIKPVPCEAGTQYTICAYLEEPSLSDGTYLVTFYCCFYNSDGVLIGEVNESLRKKNKPRNATFVSPEDAVSMSVYCTAQVGSSLTSIPADTPLLISRGSHSIGTEYVTPEVTAIDKVVRRNPVKLRVCSYNIGLFGWGAAANRIMVGDAADTDNTQEELADKKINNIKTFFTKNAFDVICLQEFQREMVRVPIGTSLPEKYKSKPGLLEPVYPFIYPGGDYNAATLKTGQYQPICSIWRYDEAISMEYTTYDDTGYLNPANGNFYRTRDGEGTYDDPYAYSDMITPDQDTAYRDKSTDTVYRYKDGGYVEYVYTPKDGKRINKIVIYPNGIRVVIINTHLNDKETEEGVFSRRREMKRLMQILEYEDNALIFADWNSLWQHHAYNASTDEYDPSVDYNEHAIMEEAGFRFLNGGYRADEMSCRGSWKRRTVNKASEMIYTTGVYTGDYVYGGHEDGYIYGARYKYSDGHYIIDTSHGNDETDLYLDNIAVKGDRIKGAGYVADILGGSMSDHMPFVAEIIIN